MNEEHEEIIGLLREANYRAKVTGTAHALVDTPRGLAVRRILDCLDPDVRILEIVRAPKWRG